MLPKSSNLFCTFLRNVHFKRKKNETPNSNTNYRTEMKLAPINMDYCLLQFDALNRFLEVRLHGEIWL